MIKLSMPGGAIIYSISPVQEIPSKTGGAPFQKRELVIQDSWTDSSGVLHPNFISVDFSGDKMALLDSFQPGQRVTINACVNGREHNGRIFNSIKGLGIAPYQEQPQQGFAPQPAPAPASAYGGGYAPQPQQGYATQPAYSHTPAYPQAPAYTQPAPAPFPSQQPAPQGPGVSGLPFQTNG